MKATRIKLPAPVRSGTVSVEEAISHRRSAYEFSPQPLDWKHVSQLAWAAQGVTGIGELRAAPSAAALYPLEMYFVLPEGAYHYRPRDHSLDPHSDGDLRAMLVDATSDQDWLANAPMLVVIAADFNRLKSRFGARAPLLAHMEAGHAAENVLLQVVALGLRGAPVGDFDRDEVRSVLKLENLTPIYLLPVGHPK